MILIADSGSTKTDWYLFDRTNTFAKIQTIGFNPYYQDTSSIVKELASSLLPYIEGSIDAIFYYGTGIANQEKSTLIKNALHITFPTCYLIEAESDVLGAARACCSNQEGIACILGTGSNSCYFDGEKIAFQVPPLGFWLGDEGSGGHLGKTLLLNYLHNEMPTEIKNLFEKKYGLLDRLTVLENAYNKPFPNRYFASFSSFIFDNLNHSFIYDLTKKCFSEFFEKYIAKYPTNKQVKVNFVGSIGYYYQDLLLEIAQSKGFKVGNILKSPIEGLVIYHQKIL